LPARQAVDLLHHFADFVAIEPGTALPMFKTSSDVRAAIRPVCVFARTTTPVDDVSSLLMDVADAFKHHRPDRKSATVGVSFAITTSYGGYGELRYGEGQIRWCGAGHRRQNHRRAARSIIDSAERSSTRGNFRCRRSANIEGTVGRGARLRSVVVWLAREVGWKRR
jgi:hypothetical protein